MPSPICDVKTSLVNDLWLPLAKKGGDQLFPLRRKHKKMKLFTLTDMNYQEVKAFEDNKLTKREDLVAWNHSHQQAYRLETELGRSKVICEGRFDDAIIIESQVISDDLPCDILNLDYFSQIPINSDGRIEREINAENVLVSLLSNLQIKGFVLLYTTLLDQVNLSLAILSFPLISPPNLPNPICNIDDKVEFIRFTINSILRNNNYLVTESNRMLLDLDNSTDKVFSIGFVSLREQLNADL